MAHQSIEALIASPVFWQLTERQGNFVAKFLADGTATGTFDATKAAQAVYHTKHPAIVGRQVLANPKVAAALDVYFRRVHRDSLGRLLADLGKLMARARDRGADTERLRRDWRRIQRSITKQIEGLR